MRTIGDIARWLKGAGSNYVIEISALKDGRFSCDLVRCDRGSSVERIEASSKISLEGALENALEELRRKENGAESMRTEKATKPDSTHFSNAGMSAIQQAIQQIYGSPMRINGPVSPLTTPTPKAITLYCPKCGHLPGGIDFSCMLWQCGEMTCSTQWVAPIVSGFTGTAYKLQAGQGPMKNWLLTYDSSSSSHKWTLLP